MSEYGMTIVLVCLPKELETADTSTIDTKEYVATEIEVEITLDEIASELGIENADKVIKKAYIVQEIDD